MIGTVATLPATATTGISRIRNVCPVRKMILVTAPNVSTPTTKQKKPV